jgi:hypothetical protein
MERDAEEIWGKSWKDRKQRWALAYRKIAKQIEKDSIEDRALDVAEPPGPADQIEKWRNEFLWCVTKLRRIRSSTQYSPRKIRELLKRAAIALKQATQALDKLPPGYVRASTRAVVASAAKKARNLEDDIRVLRKGGPQDPDLHLKLPAAEYAFDLLNDYMRTPTQSAKGSYFMLASILFEAATGRENISVARQCREHIQMMREELDDPDAFRVTTKRKRTDGA